VAQVTTLKNCVRGILKVYGIVLPKKLRAGFVAAVREAVDGHPTLPPLLDPMLSVLSAIHEQQRLYDLATVRHARKDATMRNLTTAPGVGPVVAMAYITAIDTPARFQRSSSVGAYFGMTPRRYQSGEVDAAGRISRCGDAMVRGLLFEAVSRSAKPSDLQTWGRKLAKRIGARKATVAVARKLSVILHRMWTTGEPFRWTAAPAATA
jgi:transposase